MELKCKLSDLEIDGLKRLRTLVNHSDKLKNHSLPDGMLIKCLRCKKINEKAAFSLLNSYINFIITKPNLFTWNDKVRDAIRSLLYFPYQHRGPNNEAIIGLRIGEWDYSVVKFEAIIQASLFIQEFLLKDESTQHSGFIFLIDMRKVHLRQIYHMGVANAMLLASLTEHCMPIKPINVHICFENRLTNLAYSMFRPFLSEELKQRIVFHGSDMSTLFTNLPSNYVPPDWHGTGEEIDITKFMSHLESDAHRIVKTWDSFRK